MENGSIYQSSEWKIEKLLPLVMFHEWSLTCQSKAMSNIKILKRNVTDPHSTNLPICLVLTWRCSRSRTNKKTKKQSNRLVDHKEILDATQPGVYDASGCRPCLISTTGPTREVSVVHVKVHLC